MKQHADDVTGSWVTSGSEARQPSGGANKVKRTKRGHKSIQSNKACGWRADESDKPPHRHLSVGGRGGRETSPCFIVHVGEIYPSPKSVCSSSPRPSSHSKRSTDCSHAQGHVAVKPRVLSLKVSLHDDKRNVTSSKAPRRSSSPEEDAKPRKRGRKRDYCQLYKSETCDHCYRLEGDTSSSGDEN
jgi:hypothetical protein